MIWIVVGIISICSIVYLRYRKDKKEADWDAVVIGVLIALLIWVCGNALTARFTTPDYSISKVEIASLRIDSLTQGSFVLGTGHVEQEPHYFYLEVTEQGGYKLAWSPASDTVIYEHSESGGRVLEYSPTIRSRVWSLFYLSRIDIYIPEGSIIREYSPNME